MTRWKHIAETLRELGFRIKEIMDDVDAAGERMRWVVTTSGIIVYVNDNDCRGLIAKAMR